PVSYPLSLHDALPIYATDCPVASAAALRLPLSTIRTKLAIALSLSIATFRSVRLPHSYCQVRGIGETPAPAETAGTEVTGVQQMNQQTNPARILAYDHIGIRVS